MKLPIAALVAMAACGAPAARKPVDPLLGQRHAKPDAPATDVPVEEAPPIVTVGPKVDVNVDAKVIAVLLPLTGTYAAIGKELLAAIEVAAGEEGTRRVVIDTAGDAARAVAAVDEAVTAGAVAIVGPVGVKESEAAVARAVEVGMPIAVLAPADGVAARGVFRVVDSPVTEARAAAVFAAELGVGTVAVMAPDDAVGTSAAAAFVAAAEAAGLAVTARGVYDVTGKAIEDDVKGFLGLDPATNARLARHLRRYGRKGWQTFSPDVPFALLYVPDRYDRAALIASYLPYYGVEVHSEDFADLEILQRKHGGRLPQVVQLLGSSGWNHPTLPTRGGPAVEGALIVEPCPGLLGDGAGLAFAEAFRARTRRDPSTAAAQVHDAWLLVTRARATAALSRDARAAFTAVMRGAAIDDGVCAPAHVDRDGRLVREPAVLGVEGGAITQVPY